MLLPCGPVQLDLSHPVVMGILNTTPDSFYDGGAYYNSSGFSLDMAIKRAESMVLEGATIIDIGGESTRPGATSVGLEEEKRRVLPVVEALAKRLPEVVISVDTSSPDIMRQASQVGAGMINDVRALRTPGALEAAAETSLPICLMHMQGAPDSMQVQPEYADSVKEVMAFLEERIAACQSMGIARERLLIDPGFGFGKTDEHNLTLLRDLSAFSSLELPMLVGLSRKSMIGRLLGRAEEERLPASLALACAALQRGAKILRVHDVAATYDVLRMHMFIESTGPIKPNS